MSEEGSYLPSRVSKVSHREQILFTCIWKCATVDDDNEAEVKE